MRVLSLTFLLAAASIAAASEQQSRLNQVGQAPIVASSSSAPSYRESLLSLHKSLIEVSSTSGVENAVGNVLVDYFTDKGYQIQLQFVKPMNNTPEGQERFNVLAWRGSQNPKPKVLVTSHIDVVPPHIPYGIEEGEVTGDTIITGRGSVDAKGSVAAQITALEELLKDDKIDGDEVMLLFVTGEEKNGDGMRTFSKSLKKMDHPPKFDAVIFGEPTENKLACGHKGGLFCDVKTHGVPGHSGYPWLGKSANELMVRAMSKILSTDLGSTKLFGNTTVNIGRWEGGVAANVIPEHATVNLAVRVAIGPEKDGGWIVRDKIQAIFDEIDKESFEFICTHAYGSVKTQCGVKGKSGSYCALFPY